MSDPPASDVVDYSLGSVEVSLAPLERYEEYLQSRGKKVTQQKKVLVETVYRRHEHFEAEELVEELAYSGKEEDRVSRPTVYRIIKEMVDAGLLRKLNLGGRFVYEHDYGYPQHDHLHCQQCQKLIEFQSEEFEKLRAAVAQEHHFQVTGHRLIISGICRECRQSRRRRKRPVDLL